MRSMILRMILLAVLCGGWAPNAFADRQAGDLAWAERASLREDERARPERVEEAIAHYRAALVAEPGSFETRWKLLRALHYAVDFTTHPEAVQDERVEEAVALALDAVERLEAEGGAPPDRARLYFWSSIAWGMRAQRVGLLTIVREGVATRMHDYAKRSLELDASVDRGGALRLLSRLHATLPRVPFVSGWVDRDEALRLAERGHELDPEHPGNRLILALTLHEQTSEREAEVESLLKSVANAEPRADYLVEDLAIMKQAREALEKYEGDRS